MLAENRSWESFGAVFRRHHRGAPLLTTLGNFTAGGRAACALFANGGIARPNVHGETQILYDTGYDPAGHGAVSSEKLEAETKGKKSSRSFSLRPSEFRNDRVGTRG